jgi:uncharacterized SAM-binding protein YcdF (DUF218 family)
LLAIVQLTLPPPTMNSLFHLLGIEALKPTLGTLLLPPVPLIVLVLVSARLLSRARWLAWSGMLIACAGLWASCTTIFGDALMRTLLSEPQALSVGQIAKLKNARNTAIVVLGAGRTLLAPEYGQATLKPMTAERLRYGIWLARQTGLPLAYSGGVGFGAEPGPSEAEVAARVAAQEFGLALRWTEGLSRDTQENATRTLAMLAPQGIKRIVLVTHDFHMPRAVANFQRAQADSRAPIEILAAPMGMRSEDPPTLGKWLPSRTGFTLTHLVLHEWLGRLMGA